MKKELVYIILTILLINLAVAQTLPPSPTMPPSPPAATPSTTATTPDPTIPSADTDPADPKIKLPSAPEIVSKIAARTDPVLEKEFEIRGWLETITKALFRIEGKVSISFIIIAFFLFTLLYFTFEEILYTFSLYSERTTQIISICLIVIMSALGFIKSITLSLLNIGDKIKFIENWAFAQIMLLALVIFGILIGVKKMGKKLKVKLRTEKAKDKATEEGIETGKVISSAAAWGQAIKTISKADKEP